jgi:hypothetical protein
VNRRAGLLNSLREAQEPEARAMLLIGFAEIGFAAYRRRNQATALRMA